MKPSNKPGMKIVNNRKGLQVILEGIKKLPNRDVLVGIPRETSSRTDGGMTNAAIGYIMERGAPEARIPARPWLAPGIRAAHPRIVNYLKQGAQAALDGDLRKTDRALHAAGTVAVSSIRRRIQAGLSPALATSTLQARARRRGGGVRINKGAKAELAARAAGATPGTTYAKPLIDTGAFIHSITHVLRTR